MADSVQSLLLNKGVDTVTPPIMTEPGSLTDCLNYEMVSDIGYRRIDGYETYDGWVGGDISEYYVVPVTINDAAVVAELVPGQMIANSATDLVVGVVVNYTGTTTSGTLTYVPANNEAPMLANPTTLATTRTGATRLTTSGVTQKGSVLHDATTFVANIRTYGAALRALVPAMPGVVAGLHWHRNNLVAAIDADILFYTDGNSTSIANVAVGSFIGLNTTIYRVIYKTVNTTPSPDEVTLHVVPVGTQANNASLRVYYSDMATIFYTSATAANFVLTSGQPSDWAYLIALNNPETSETRGSRLLDRTVTVEYTGGTPAMLSSVNWGQLGFLSNVGTIGFTVVSHTSTGGDYNTNTGTGFLELRLAPTGSATYTYPKFGDLIQNQVPTTMGSIGNIVSWAKAAGSRRLRTNESRYTGIIANFYGDELRSESFVATGASRALWIRAYDDPLTKNPYLSAPTGATALTNTNNLDWCWGNIVAIQNDEPIDIPKYVANHSGALAIAYERGSVQLSVPGEPHNFNGLDGAHEIATGDAITGLLEAIEDNLIVFGRRSICRITGTVDADLQMHTVSPNTGCFDYTAVNIGSQPVFCGPAGISTLAQAQEYGDFIGQRLTDKITTTFVPKLITDYSDTEPGGVAMALAIRHKNQYKLWLTTGEVVTVTMTSEGPKITKQNYSTYAGPGVPDTLCVPFAWCSEIADSFKERTHVAWDAVLAANNVLVTGVVGGIPNQSRIHELERGWGFNGTVFEAYFDLAFVFPTKGVQTTGVHKVRMYGMGHGVATLDVKTAGIETNFEQSFHSTVQDISMPTPTGAYFPTMHPVMSIIDQANWGLGIRVRINNTNPKGGTLLEPPHICQVINLFVRTEGALDA